MRNADFMLASPAPMRVGDVDLSAWTFDLKLDGLRAMVEWDGWTAKLWSRSGIDISERFPELILSAKLLTVPCVIDGEVMTTDGSFQSVAQRGKANINTIADLVHENPAQFFAFDILELDHDDVTMLTYLQRRQLLEGLFEPVTENPHWRLTITAKDPAFPQSTRDLGMEGVIAKLDAAPYIRGVRAKTWLKFKNRHRVFVSCHSYTTGNGARKEFGALNMATYNSVNEAVNVGRVGSGFTERDIVMAKREIAAEGYVVAEVECLGLTKNRQLRQPTLVRLLSWNEHDGLRIQCPTEQLHDMPTA